MTPRTYATPAAFKEALEQRLRSAGTVDLSRRRQLLFFDRLLARVAVTFGEAAVLKGGVALELRLDRARTTKDIDLRLMGSPEDLLSRLQELGQLDLGDFMTFEIEPDPHHPEIQNEGMQYEGLRLVWLSEHRHVESHLEDLLQVGTALSLCLAQRGLDTRPIEGPQPSRASLSSRFTGRDGWHQPTPARSTKHS